MGVAYILKLLHLVGTQDSRAIHGPYSMTFDPAGSRWAGRQEFRGSLRC